MRAEQAATGQDRFGRELRRLRERAGFTQVQLATRLGYDHTYLSKLESGTRLPQLVFAGQADDLLNASGVLVALATNVRARRRSGGDGNTAAGDEAGMPLPCPPSPIRPLLLPPPQPIHLPTFGVTCPLHGSVGCTVSDPPTGLADLLDNDARTVGTETAHGFAALLIAYIEADHEALTGELAVPVEKTLRVLLGLVPKARGPMSVALMRLAAEYANLAGSLRVKRGQHGIGMTWLHRSWQWAMNSRALPTACEALNSMSLLALLEGDGATALEYGRAAAAAAPQRRWTIVQSKLHQARSHALLGDWREFTQQSDQAQRAVERLGDQDRAEAPWLFGTKGEAYIASHLAGGLRDLADTTGDSAIAGRAVGFAQTSLANIPTRMHGSRLLLTLRLADSQACSGDLEAAVIVARPVVQAAQSARITLVQQELDRLRTRFGGRCGELLDSC